MVPRLNLVHGPTPLMKVEALDTILGVDTWIKRDDVTGGAESGNKLRKLEYLLSDAITNGATHIITCGALQSNHARATAIVAARFGLGCTLLLRVGAGGESGPPGPHVDAPEGLLPQTANGLLMRLAGARIRLVTPRDYDDRAACMEQIAAELRVGGARAYVIPEGGSNGLGALGYVAAMREVREQMDLGLAGGREPFDEVVHACGSGGTAAGIALGAQKYAVASRVRSVGVCNDKAYFDRLIARIMAEARAFDDSLSEPASLVLDENAKGPAYGAMDDQQLSLLTLVARKTGVLTDPVYTGKALFGIRAAVERGELRPGSRVLFLHSGGLVGLLAEGDSLARALAR